MSGRATEKAKHEDGNAAGSGNTGQTTVGGRQRKLKPSEANFQKKAGIPGFRCGDCFYYEAQICRIVEGQKIQPDDTCDEFEPDRRGKLTSGGAGVPGIVKDYSVIGPMRRVTTQIATHEMFITRVAKDRQTGVLRWFSKASGIERDLYDERMSVELFKDFVKRVESKEDAPTPFSSKAWAGGLPYLGVAHYLDLNGDGIAGDTERVWIDGDIFKAKGTFRKTAIGLASYKAIKNDFSENKPDEFRVRVSIAFIDWAHEHEGFGNFTRNDLIDRCDMCERGLGEKVYRAGHLVHLALTRRPAYPRASIALEENNNG